MPINTTGVSKNFLPMFTPSGNLASDMRKIEIAKSISFAWLKGQFTDRMRKAGNVIKIDGKEYFSAVGIRHISNDFFNEGTKGYWTAEALRLLGYDDSSLKKLRDASRGDLDNIVWVWRKHRTETANDFSYYADVLRQEIAGVDSIEIEYELDRYKNTVYTTEASRVYNPKSTTGYSWATACVPNPSIYKWTLNEAWYTTPDIIHKAKEYVWGKIKLLSAGVDVTANYSVPVKNALVACIAYSGDSFMTRTSATKIGERSYTVYSGDEYQTVETFISAIGKETFDANIKQTFIDDTSEIFWRHYSAFYDCNLYNRYEQEDCYPYDITSGVTRQALTRTANRYRITSTYSQFFWELSGADYSGAYRRLNLVDDGEEYLFREYSYMSAVMNVDEFLKLNIDEFTFYMGKYFDFDINYNNGTFFDKIVGALGNIFSFLIGTLFDIFYHIPVLRQMMQLNTYLVQQAFHSDITAEELFTIQVQIALIGIGYSSQMTAITAGEATATTAGQAGTLTASEQVAIATANTSALVSTSATLASALGASFSSSIAFANFINTLSSSYSIYQSMENIEKFDDAREVEEQRSKQEVLDKAEAKQKEKDLLDEHLKQRISEGEYREHLNFLENPLYMVSYELKLGDKYIDSEMNKQFNLI